MLLGDDNRGRDEQRNLTLVIVVMAVFVIGYTWLNPPTPPPPAVEQSVGTTTTETPTKTTSPLEVPGALATTSEESTPDSATQGAFPPVASNEALPDDEIKLQSDNIAVVFTRVGARLKQATLLLGKDGTDTIDLVPPVEEGTADVEAIYPLGLRFEGEYLGDSLDVRRWDATPGADGKSVAFTLEIPGKARITKTFSLDDAPHVVDASITYTNLEAQSRRLGTDTHTPAFSLTWGPNVASGDHDHYMVKQQVIWRHGEILEHFPTAKLVADDKGNLPLTSYRDSAWMGIKSAYFMVALKPEFENPNNWVTGETDNFRIGSGVPRTEVAANETVTFDYRLYVGPGKQSWLKAAWPDLVEAQQFFTSSWFSWLDLFAKLLLWLLNWFHDSVIANYGLAIIFITILVRGAVFPLTFKGMKSMKKMQKLAPELEKMKAEIGDDQQEIQKRMMELYKERGVNPLGGCFPLLIQMPVFITLYRMLASTFELRHAPFYGWIKDLSAPDAFMALPFNIPLPMPGGQGAIDTLNLLPILMGISMVVSVRIMPTSGPVTNPQQKIMMNIMPVIFSVICYNMAAGLNLYILTSTWLGVLQNYFVHVSDSEVKALKRKPGSAKKKRPKHFYNAAQAKKREMAKEVRRDKKAKHQRGNTDKQK